MNIRQKILRIPKGFFRWFSPAELIIPTHVLYLLRSIYPEVNWEKVKFHDGLPWFTSTFSSWTSAIVLPSTFGCSKVNVYFKNFDPDSCAGLSIIVHEGFHVLQYKDIGTKGIGWLRLFIIQYIASCISLGKNCYAKHPMEKQAYTHDALFRKACSASRSPKNTSLKFNEELINAIIKSHPQLIKSTSGFKYDSGWGYLFLSFLLLVIIAILLPTIYLILLLLCFVLLLASPLLYLFEWILMDK